MVTYLPRILDHVLANRLKTVGAVVVEGVKACGKTETARAVAGSEVLLDIDSNARAAAQLDPRLVLAGAPPRLLDEWQVEPTIWNAVRRAVDEDPAPGRFILTGSATPSDEATRHTGAGRFSRLRMRPFTAFESGWSSGEVSLGALLRGEAPMASGKELPVGDLIDYIMVGGWPTLQGARHGGPRWVRDYIEELRHLRPLEPSGAAFDPLRIGSLLESISRNIATNASNASLASDMGQQLEAAVRSEAVSSYLNALERLMVLERLPAWAPQLRSRSRLRQAQKLHFVDPSIAVAALRADHDELLADLNYLGFLFESLVIRDLRVYGQVHDAEVSYYRDNTGLEADAVIHIGRKAWVGVEVKLGSSKPVVDQAANNLLTLSAKVDPATTGAPKNLVVITGTGHYAYRRQDGVSVVPITLLGP